MRPSYLRMEGHGAYLLENGEMCIVWLGANVNPRLLEDLYGVNSLEEVDARMTRLPKLPTKLSKQVRAIVQSFAQQRNKPELPVLIARQNRDGTEVELANSLVEDQNNDAMSYVDYLCHVHRIISSDMTSDLNQCILVDSMRAGLSCLYKIGRFRAKCRRSGLGWRRACRVDGRDFEWVRSAALQACWPKRALGSSKV
ncbi:hypothetical protein L1887_60215 [Cichorium endivia]|nr:hypothetical protein L1887_60215 [Cichorium endivia]